MSQVEMKMPKMGESVAEATIIKWLKNEGETVEADEPVLEIATDKVDSEVPSTASGVLSKRMFNEGDVVQVGAVIALISTDGAAAAPVNEVREAESSRSTPAASETPQVPHVPTPVAPPAQPAVAASSGNGRFYSPLVRNIARQENVSQTELDNIQGTGAEGRVTKKDILLYLKNRESAPQPAAAPSAPTAQPTATPAAPKEETPAVAVSGDEEIVEMDRMRKLIAEHMVKSKQTSPHVTSYVEADVTNLVAWRNKVKKEFEKRENEKITFTPIFIEAIIKAIKDFPMSSFSATNITF